MPFGRHPGRSRQGRRGRLFDDSMEGVAKQRETVDAVLSMRTDGSFGQHAGDKPVVEVRSSTQAAGNESGDTQPGAIALAISQRELDERTSVLTVEGELDLFSAPRLKWALTDLLGTGRSQVVVDLSLVTFMDSTALGVLVGVKRSLGADARLAICAHANVLKIFELCGLDGTFDIFSTFDDALACARGSTAAAG
jgi:anti-sigma B factor antagonist